MSAFLFSFFFTFDLILKEILSQQLIVLLIQGVTKSSVLLHSFARRVELFQHRNNCKVSFYPRSHKKCAQKFFWLLSFLFYQFSEWMLHSSVCCTDHWVLCFAVGSGNVWFHGIIQQKALADLKETTVG